MKKVGIRVFVGWLINAFVLLMCLSMPSVAEDEEAPPEEGAEAMAQAIYLPLKPAFIVNYGGSGRLRYLKIEISVRLANIDAANAVRYHSPYVRNNLMMLFASQTNETVGSQEGKEKIRLDALEEVRNVVEKENETPREDVVDLFFNNFIVQR